MEKSEHNIHPVCILTDIDFQKGKHQIGPQSDVNNVI